MLFPANLDFIKESIYYSGTRPEFDRLVYKNRRFDNHGWLKIPLIWLVYLDDPELETISKKHAGMNADFRTVSFKNILLNRINPTEDDILYLIAVYHLTRLPESEIFIEKKAKENPFQEFTRHTYGRLIFHEQAHAAFEHVTGCSKSEAQEWMMELTMGWNRVVLGNTLTYHITETYTLMDAWQDYTIGGQLRTPKPELAKHIYQKIYGV